jgi:hypothetical protein
VIESRLRKARQLEKDHQSKKLRADITQMLDDLKESGNDKFEGYGENNN